MSEKEPEGKQQSRFNPFSIFKNRGGDQRMQGISELIRSNRHNETKTRIPHVLGMSYMDCSGALASSSNQFSYQVNDEGKQAQVDRTFPRTLEGLMNFWGERYRINAISKAGQSRLEYVDALKSYLAAQAELMNTAQQQRAEEGVKKKE